MLTGGDGRGDRSPGFFRNIDLVPQGVVVCCIKVVDGRTLLGCNGNGSPLIGEASETPPPLSVIDLWIRESARVCSSPCPFVFFSSISSPAVLLIPGAVNRYFI